MGIFDKLRGEFIDVIEWTEGGDRDLLAVRFPRYNNEIKMGAKLTVREGQAAVFVNEGQIADVFKPGMYELATNNLPILSTLKGWKHGFQSPFKSEIYFVMTRQVTGRKWGTANPIIKRDSDFGMVRLRAFGSYVFRVVDPAAFIRELVSTDPTFEDYEIDAQLKQTVVSEFADVVGRSSIPVLDLVGNYEALSKFVLESVQDDFKSWGLELTKFYVENISVPPAVEEAIDRRTQMGVVGDLSQYARFQAAEAMRAASANPAGGAGAGMGLGAGVALGQQMAEALSPKVSPGQTNTPAGVPPPLPTEFHVAIDGEAKGPFRQTDMVSLIAKGQLTRDTLVWSNGFAAWTPAGQVASLTSLFGSQPPPLPK